MSSKNVEKTVREGHIILKKSNITLEMSRKHTYTEQKVHNVLDGINSDTNEFIKLIYSY